MNGKHLGIGKMDKQYNVLNIDFNGELMILSVDEKTYQIPITQASKRLAQATDIERKMYRISPSGYGIHWSAIDEDLTTKGLIKLAEISKTA
jgi:beta-xylosidase